MTGPGTVSGRLASIAIGMGLTESEVRGDRALRASITEKAGLTQRVRSDVWRTAVEALVAESERAARSHTGSARCKRCAEPIRWVVTKGGKNMPLNPLPHPGGNVILTTATGGKGTVAQVVPNTSLPVHGSPAYRTHYASCKYADQFRRRRDPKRSRACPVCEFRMDPWLIDNGYTTHPTCQEPT